jgi:hypothetical protein
MVECEPAEGAATVGKAVVVDNTRIGVSVLAYPGAVTSVDEEGHFVSDPVSDHIRIAVQRQIAHRTLLQSLADQPW